MRRARGKCWNRTYTQRCKGARTVLCGQRIQAVPSVIINDKYLIQGGQPVEVFEQSLRQIVRQPESTS